MAKFDASTLGDLAALDELLARRSRAAVRHAALGDKAQRWQDEIDALDAEIDALVDGLPSVAKPHARDRAKNHRKG